MAVIADEATAKTVVQLQTSVRRFVGDTESSAANQRWTDAEINEALNFELSKMAAEWGLGQASQAMTTASLTYTADAQSVALPSGPDVNPIFMVEDNTDSSNPIRLEYRPFLDHDMHNVSSAYVGSRGYTWARAGTSIAIRPLSGTALTLQIWYVRPPYNFTLDGSGDETDGTDNHPWPVQHEELVALGAAIRLQQVDGEVPPGRIEWYADLWQRFIRSKNHARGPRYVRTNRRYR